MAEKISSWASGIKIVPKLITLLVDLMNYIPKNLQLFLYKTLTLACLLSGTQAQADGAKTIPVSDAIQIAPAWKSSNSSSTIDEALRQTNPLEQYVMRCKEAICSYNNNELNLNNVPLIGGFSLLEPYFEKTGELNLMLVNEINGEFLSLNPSRVSGFVYNCVDVGLLGHHGQDPNTATDSICTVKGANGYTFIMLGALESWVVHRNVGLDIKNREGHLNSMAGEVHAMGGEEGLLTAIGDLSALPMDKYAYECHGISPCAVSVEKHDINWHMMPGWQSTYPRYITFMDGSTAEKITVNMRKDYDGSQILISLNPYRRWDGQCYKVTAGELCKPNDMTDLQQSEFEVILGSFKV